MNDCNKFDDDTYAFCEVVRCGRGFSCSFPDNSFLIPYHKFAVLELVFEYTWSAEQRDLDTSTTLLGVEDIKVGFSCNGSHSNIVYGGDNASFGGTELTVVDLQDSAGGLFDDNVSIEARAGWHGSKNQGPARLSVYMRGKRDKVLETGTILSTRIYPGTQSGCPSTHVATVRYFNGYNATRITLSSV